MIIAEYFFSLYGGLLMMLLWGLGRFKFYLELKSRSMIDRKELLRNPNGSMKSIFGWKTYTKTRGVASSMVDGQILILAIALMIYGVIWG